MGAAQAASGPALLGQDRVQHLHDRSLLGLGELANGLDLLLQPGGRAAADGPRGLSAALLDQGLDGGVQRLGEP